MNKRDTFYFPHEYNAKDDPKCERLIWEMGMEGYGMFWALLEVLRAQPDYTYPVANIPIIARKYNADPEKLRHVVFDFGLFSIVDDRIFFSNGLTARMQVIDDRRKRLSEAGRRGMAERWRSRHEASENSQAITTLLQPYNSKVKKSKGEYIKKHTNVCKESADKPRKVAAKREAFVAPLLGELRAYISEQGLTNVNPEEFIDYYTANGWRAGKNPMKDWKAAVRNWNRRQKEFTTTKPQTDGSYEIKPRYAALC